jgi:hypothetical protein
LVAALAGYLVLAVSHQVVVWDGLAPSPYRYVQPPPGYINAAPPSAAKGTVTFSGGKSSTAQVFTDDLQAQLLISEGAFPPDAASDPINITIDPLAPSGLGQLTPFGNAYAVKAIYSNGTAVPGPWKAQATLYLRYPAQGLPDDMFRLDASGPVALKATVDLPTLTVKVDITEAGTYVPAGSKPAAPPVTTVKPAGGSITPAVLVLGAGGLLLVVAGIVIIARGRLRRESDDEPAK